MKKTINNRINILLLGTGGGTHDGPNLSDTVIFASIDPKANKITMISIPRDLWVPDVNGKINTAYADGEAKGQGQGLVLAKAVVGNILHQNIDYAIRLDFAGFVKAVDEIGGLDINVDEAFDDYDYPDEANYSSLCGHTDAEATQLIATESPEIVFPCRYEHLHFDAGMQHMDGERALEYVRSRHALGPEGSDFARSKRQQKVITAFRSKVLSAQTLLNPEKLLSLYGILGSSVATDIKQDEFDDFIRLAEKMKTAKIQTIGLDTGDDSTNRFGVLINPPATADFGYAWVLTPRTGNGNFTEIQQYTACLLAYKTCTIKDSYANDIFGTAKSTATNTK